MKRKPPTTTTIEITDALPWSGTLTAEEKAIVFRPIVGNGGHQILLRRVHGHIDPATGAFTLPAIVVFKILGHALDYGRGGYQVRLEALLRALERVKR